MSYQGIDSLPQLTFSANTTQPIKAITYSTDTTINDDESLPTTKWVNDKISAASFNTDSPTFTGTTTVTNLNATGNLAIGGINYVNPFIVGMTLKLKVGVNPPSSTGTWKRVGIWGVYDTTLTKSNTQFHIYTMYNGMYATANIRVSNELSHDSLALTELGLASTDSSAWFVNSGYNSDSSYPVGTVQVPINTKANAEFKFNGANIEPQGSIHAFSYDSIFSFSVKITDFSNSSYKHQYVEWEKTA